mmetsp:Transcript_28581/g.31751  ORF Transcript_28581/g.31751 Transcript_28581/m.31751 type:complete len:355 (-) Transcript_28581:80-1144(-)
MMKQGTNMDCVPPETLTHILRYLPKKERIRATTVSHLFNNIIRNNIGFVSLCVKRDTVSLDCNTLKHSPLLKNTRIFGSYRKLSDSDLACLQGVHTIGLQNATITDSGILSLVEGGHTIHTINLCNTDITDVSLKALKGVHTIDIYGCKNITSEGIKALGDVHNIKLLDQTGSLLKCLGNVHTVNTSHGGYEKLSVPDGIKSLTNVKHLNLRSLHAGDACLKCLVNLEYLHLRTCFEPTGSCFKHLVNLRYLKFESCNKIDDSSLKCLGNLETLETLEIGLNNASITGSFIKYLVNLKYLSISQQLTEFTTDCLKQMKSLKRITFHGNCCSQISREDVEALGIIYRCKILRRIC